MLSVEIKKNDINDIIYLSGRFDGIGAVEFDKQTISLENTDKNIILDFSNINYLSSAGIRSIIKLIKTQKKNNREILFAGLNTDIKQTLDMTGLLNQLRIFENTQTAIKHSEILSNSNTAINNIKINDREYGIIKNERAYSYFEYWKTNDDCLSAVTLKELGISLGSGGIGNNAEDAATAQGNFLTANNFAAVAPLTTGAHADYIFTKKNDEAIVYIKEAVGIAGDPLLKIKTTGSAINLNTLIADSFKILAEKFSLKPDIFSFLLSGKSDKNNFVFTAGIATSTENNTLKPEFNNILTFIKRNANAQKNIENRALIFNNCANIELLDIESILNGSISFDDFNDSLCLDFKGNSLSNIELWIFIPETVVSGFEKNVIIEVKNNEMIPEEWKIIIRRIYSDYSKVQLEPLAGGFSSKTYRVNGYDKQGRRLLPTVIKIGPVALTERERDACEKYVKPYILNNSTTVMGSAAVGKFAGLAYNFVGITGPDSKIEWLTKYYQTKEPTELIPLFDKIFTDIFKPWYGQPRWELCYPYAEHSPLHIFSGIFDAAKEQFNISVDDEYIDCPELQRKFKNPIKFLKYDYAERANKSILWYRGITHGDLNMQNILLDEKENIYMIDFSETKLRNIVSDFARLEPIFKLEMTRMNDTNDLTELIKFDLGLAKAVKINEIPPFEYSGTDESVKKAYALICKIRQYANTVTLFETNIAPYWLAMLEWTFSVLCYGGVNPLTKKMALYSAAIYCEKLQ